MRERRAARPDARARSSSGPRRSARAGRTRAASRSRSARSRATRGRTATTAKPRWLTRRPVARASTARRAKKSRGIHLTRTATTHASAARFRRLAAGERERAEDERDHQRVVVAAAGEVDREERIPADERRGVRPVARKPGGEEDAREHGERRHRLEDPGRGRGRRARDQRDGSGDAREQRPVDGGRVAPRRAGVLVGRVVRIVARDVDVGVAVVDGRDPSVLPVGPGIGREEERPGERDDLDRQRDEQDGTQAGRPPAQQREPDEIGGERRDEESEEDDPEPAAVGPAGIGRDERSALDPRAGDTARDEQRDRSRREERGATHLAGVSRRRRWRRLGGRRRRLRRRRRWWWRRGRRRSDRRRRRRRRRRGPAGRRRVRHRLGRRGLGRSRSSVDSVVSAAAQPLPSS